MKAIPVITAYDISIGYGKTTYGSNAELYSGLSLELYQGELVCLLGQNGAGKSTLLRTLASMQPALSGEIILDGKNLRDYSEAELAHKIGLVLTDKTSIGGFRVSEIVALGRYPYTGFWGRLNAQDKEIIRNSMNDVGILHKADSYMAELSDGERQKVMIAKALAQECPIVFLDEPTAFLDITSRIEIMDLLHRLAHDNSKSILLSTHDIELALLLADRLWLLSRNNGLRCGITEDIVLDGSLDLFLSKNDILFDSYSGSFYPHKSFSKFVYIDKNEANYRWLKNFMERNSWGVTESVEDADMHLNFDNNNIIVTINDDITKVSSFNDLRDALKNNELIKSGR